MDNNNEKWYDHVLFDLLIVAGVMVVAVGTVAAAVIFFAVVEAVIGAVFS